MDALPKTFPSKSYGIGNTISRLLSKEKKNQTALSVQRLGSYQFLSSTICTEKEERQDIGDRENGDRQKEWKQQIVDIEQGVT